MAEEADQPLDVLRSRRQEELLANKLHPAQPQAAESDLILEFREERLTSRAWKGFLPFTTLLSSLRVLITVTFSTPTGDYTNYELPALQEWVLSEIGILRQIREEFAITTLFGGYDSRKE